MAKGTLFAALEKTRDDLGTLRDGFPELVDLVSNALDESINDAIPALMGDPQYALLNAKRVCEMVIDVVVAAELLQQAKLSEARHALAECFIRRRMLHVDLNAQHIKGGDATRIKRYDHILGL